MAFSRKLVTQSIPTYEEIISRSGLEKNQLDKECSSHFFLQLSDQVDYWKDYADVLWLKEHEISGIENDSSLSPRFKCKKMLESWHKRFGFKATYLELMKAFATMGNAKLAQTVCYLFKGTACTYMHACMCLIYLYLVMQGNMSTITSPQSSQYACREGTRYRQCMHCIGG